MQSLGILLDNVVLLPLAVERVYGQWEYSVGQGVYQLLWSISFSGRSPLEGSRCLKKLVFQNMMVILIDT